MPTLGLDYVNSLKVCVNFALFVSPLLSLCFGQTFASSPSSPRDTTWAQDGSEGFISADFPSDAEPNFVLGGLFPVHSKNVTDRGLTCGSLNVERGIHRLEAMIYAVDEINKDANLLSNITLGMVAYDTCGWYTRALDQSLEFVMAKTNPANCQSTTSRRVLLNKNDSALVGVVGAAASTVSVQVANLLRLFKLPQVSYASTTPDLSDKSKYDYFVRTVPPDNYQARAMVDVVHALKWTSVFTVNSEGIYGDRGIREFITEARAVNICIAGSFKIERGPSGDKNIEVMFKEFSKRRNTRGIVVFCTDADAKRILEEAKRNKNSVGRFIWVASDSWGTKKKTIEGLEEFAEGAITISLTEASFPSFTEYFTSLKPGNHSQVNPWFDSFWEKQFHCSLKQKKRICAKGLSLKNVDMRIDDKVPFVIDAVYAIAHALDRVYKNLCPSQRGLCSNMMQNFDGKNFRDALFNVSFNSITGPVTFDSNGNGPGKYDIYRLKGGKYEKVASWNEKLYNATELLKGGRNGTTPLSSCGETCRAGHYKVFDYERTCCWTCQECPENNYVQGNTCGSLSSHDVYGR